MQLNVICAAYCIHLAHPTSARSLIWRKANMGSLLGGNCWKLGSRGLQSSGVSGLVGCVLFIAVFMQLDIPI